MLNHDGNTLLSFTDSIVSLGSLQLCAITMKNMLLFTFFLFPLHLFFFCNTPYGANLVRQECHPDLGSQMIHSTLNLPVEIMQESLPKCTPSVIFLQKFCTLIAFRQTFHDDLFQPPWPSAKFFYDVAVMSFGLKCKFG